MVTRIATQVAPMAAKASLPFHAGNFLHHPDFRLFSFLGFRFLLNLHHQNYNTNANSNSNTNAAHSISDPNLFLESVRHQCNLGFSNTDHPVSLFHRMTSLRPLPSMFDFNQLFFAIMEITQNNKYNHSIVVSLSRQLELSGLRRLNYLSLVILTDCYCVCRHVGFGLSILGKTLKLGYNPDCELINSLLKGLNRVGRVPEAVELFERMVKLGIRPNRAMYESMIRSCFKNGDDAVALNVFREMESDGCCKPDVMMYRIVIRNLCKHRRMNEAVELLRKLENDGSVTCLVIYCMVIDGLCEAGRVKDAVEIFRSLVVKDVQLNNHVCNAMIKGLCKNGLLDKANELLKAMEENGRCSPNGWTYNTVVKGFLKGNNMEKALELLDVMKRKKFDADGHTNNLLRRKQKESGFKISLCHE